MKHTTRTPKLLVLTLPVLLLLGAAVGCDDKKTGSGGAPSASVSAAASTAAPASASVAVSASASASAQPEKQRRGHGGADDMVFAAAKAQELKPEQKTKIEEIEKKLGEPDHKNNGAKMVHDDLVAGIKAGKVDEAKLKAAYESVEKSVQARHDDEATALTSLHAALEPAQRKAVAADVKAKLTERASKFQKDKDPVKEKERIADKNKKRVAKMKKDLDLDEAQEKKVEALITKSTANPVDERAEHHKKAEALVAAFEKDTFDAKKLDLFAGAGKAARAKMEQEIKQVTDLIPILKPEQREKLAAQLERKKAPHFGRGHHGRPEASDDDDHGHGGGGHGH